MFGRRRKQKIKDYGSIDGTVEELAVALTLTMMDILHTLSPEIRTRVAKRIRENSVELGQRSFSSQLVARGKIQEIRNTFLRVCE